MNNWRPVIGSLLSILQKHDFHLTIVDNGGGDVSLDGTPRQKRQQAKKEICAVDVSDLYVVTDEDDLLWLQIVLGNEPHETVANYTCNKKLDIALEDFEQKWKDRKCPTV